MNAILSNFVPNSKAGHPDNNRDTSGSSCCKPLPGPLAKSAQGNGNTATAGPGAVVMAPFFAPPTEDRPAAIDATREAIRFGVARAIARALEKSRCGQDLTTAKTSLVRMLVKAPPGIGKTHAACEALQQGAGIVTAAMFPTQEKVAEFAELYGKVSADNPDAPDLLRVRGRRSLDPERADEATMCALPAQAGRIAELGGNVREDLCGLCPHAPDCAYLRQEQRIRDAAASPRGIILAAPHDYLTIPLPGGVTPDVTLFDEAPRNGWSLSTRLTFDALSGKLTFIGSRRPKSKATATGEQLDALTALVTDIIPTLGALRNAVEATGGRYNGNGIMARLRAAGISRSRVETALGEITKFGSNAVKAAVEQARLEAAVRPRTFARALDQAPAELTPDLTCKLRTVFAALLVEFDHGRDDAVAIYGADVWTKDLGRVAGLRVDRLIRPRVQANAPLLVLDGTGDPEMVQAVFGPMAVIEHRTERNAIVTFVTGQSFSQAQTTPNQKRSWSEKTQRNAESLRRALQTCRQRLARGESSRLAVFCNRSLRDKLGWMNDPMVGHFQNLRGSNKWEEARACMVIDRPLPPMEEIEASARAFAAAAGDPFTSLEGACMPTEQRPIRMQDGTGHPLAVPSHPDPWGDRVLRQVREAEIEQAIDRLRLIRNDLPKEVFILGQVTVDVTADRVMSWTDFREGGSRYEQALQRTGVVPINPSEMARLLPEVWHTTRTAERDLKDEDPTRALVRHLSNSSLLFGECRTKRLTLCSYRQPPAPGKRVHMRHALVLAADGTERAVLEALTGPQAAFEREHVLWSPPASNLALQEADAAAERDRDRWKERAAILEYEAGFSRQEAEARAGISWPRSGKIPEMDP